MSTQAADQLREQLALLHFLGPGGSKLRQRLCELDPHAPDDDLAADVSVRVVYVGLQFEQLHEISDEDLVLIRRLHDILTSFPRYHEFRAHDYVASRLAEARAAGRQEGGAS